MMMPTSFKDEPAALRRDRSANNNSNAQLSLLQIMEQGALHRAEQAEGYQSASNPASVPINLGGILLARHKKLSKA